MYDHGAAALETVHAAYGDLHFLLRTRSALITAAFAPRYTTVHAALESYRLFLHPLERVGMSGHVQAVHHVYP